jgi:putative cell wall-binding protein
MGNVGQGRRPRTSATRTAAAAALGLGAAIGVFGAAGATGAQPSHEGTSANAAAAGGLSLALVWRRVLSPGSPTVIALSSPSLSTLTGGPAVVVGSRDKEVYAFHLATGGTLPHWPKNVGAPVTSTPSSVQLPGTAHDTVLVGTGNASPPFTCSGGYQWLSPGGQQNLVLATNPATDTACAHNGVRASMAVGELQGVAGTVAGSMGQMTYAMDASSRGVLAGFPWFQADSNFATPAIADLGGGGSNDIVEGGSSTAGTAYGQTYTDGGHIRVLNASGGLVCKLTTTEAIDSSPAVGRFLAATQVGIVAGTGSTYPNAPERDHVIALNSACQEVWSDALAGTTANESPAVADLLGDGRLDVVETTWDPATGGGGVDALTGATGSVLWHRALAHGVIGSPVTAELSPGQQDVVVATVSGFDILTGASGTVLVATRTTTTGFQNAPLVTDDPNGSVGITVAGYQAADSVVEHFELTGTSGADVDARGAWPQFHHDPQLTGDAGAPYVPLGQVGQATRIFGTTADATAARELETQFPPGARCPGTTSTRSVVLATDANYPDALASAPLARSLGTGTLLTGTDALSATTRAALAAEGITHVDVVGGPLAVSATVVSQLEATPADACGGASSLGRDITVTRLFGTAAPTTAATIAAHAAQGGVGTLDLSGAYAANASGHQGLYNETSGGASPGPSGAGALPTAVVATAEGFQDAMGASTFAYAQRLPILLTTRTALPAATLRELGALGVDQVIVMGGPLAVSTAVVTAMEQQLGVSVLRVAGVDYTDTAVQLARLETAPSPAGAGWRGTGGVTVARGDFFTDGLAGAVVAADGPTSGAPEPLLLSLGSRAIGSILSTFLYRAGATGLGGEAVSRLTVLGGPLALSQTSVDEMGADL